MGDSSVSLRRVLEDIVKLLDNSANSHESPYLHVSLGRPAQSEGKFDSDGSGSYTERFWLDLKEAPQHLLGPGGIAESGLDGASWYAVIGEGVGAEGREATLGTIEFHRLLHALLVGWIGDIREAATRLAVPGITSLERVMVRAGRVDTSSVRPDKRFEVRMLERATVFSRALLSALRAPGSAGESKDDSTSETSRKKWQEVEPELRKKFAEDPKRVASLTNRELKEEFGADFRTVKRCPTYVKGVEPWKRADELEAADGSPDELKHNRATARQLRLGAMDHISTDAASAKLIELMEESTEED